jgi:hypothetical protein
MRQQFAPAAPGDVGKSSGKRASERGARRTSMMSVRIFDGSRKDSSCRKSGRYM